MKSSTIKVTYSLDPLSVSEIESLAKAWKVPKSEVVRRSVHAAASRNKALAPRRLSKEEALKLLQSEPRLSPSAANKWIEEIHAERLTR